MYVLNIKAKVIFIRGEYFSSIISGKLRDFIPGRERKLLNNQFDWPKKYFDAQISESNNKSVSYQPSKNEGRLGEEDIERWAERMFIVND